MSETNVHDYEIRIKHEVYGRPEEVARESQTHALEYCQWRIYIDGNSETLDKIRRVEYLLDPSFSRSRIVTENKENKFQYEVFGYGSFTLRFLIYLNKKREPIAGEYYLDINKSNDEGLLIKFKE